MNCFAGKYFLEYFEIFRFPLTFVPTTEYGGRFSELIREQEGVGDFRRVFLTFETAMLNKRANKQTYGQKITNETKLHLDILSTRIIW